jgi:putative inorganic carbon (HCO3(-)) transporter
MQVSSCLNRFVTEIYATLVGVLFLEDLVSQVAKGSVRYVIAPVKDVLLLLLLAMAVPKIKVVPRPVLYAVGFIYALVGLAALRAPSLTAAVLGFRDVYWGLLLLLATIVLATQRALVGLFWAIILMGNIGAIIAVATHSLGMWWVDAVVRSGGRIASNYFTTGGYGNPRAFSPFQEPNVLGAAMVVVILTALLRPIPVTKVVWAATPLPLVALLMSKSRSAVLGLILGLAVWGSRKQEPSALVPRLGFSISGCFNCRRLPLRSHDVGSVSKIPPENALERPPPGLGQSIRAWTRARRPAGGDCFSWCYPS